MTEVTIDHQQEDAYALSIGAKINDLGWPRAITHFISKHMRLSESTAKIWMNIDPYYQWRRCSPMTLDSGNIRFMRIIAGVPWRRGFKQQWGNRKRWFSCFRALRLQHLKKEGQHYYIVLFSPLSPFHWPQNVWIWGAILRSIFTITNSVSAIKLHLSYRAIYRIFLLYDVTSRDVRKRILKTVIRRILRLRERIADLSETTSCGSYIVGILTNKPNISI